MVVVGQELKLTGIAAAGKAVAPIPGPITDKALVLPGDCWQNEGRFLWIANAQPAPGVRSQPAARGVRDRV